MTKKVIIPSIYVLFVSLKKRLVVSFLEDMPKNIDKNTKYGIMYLLYFGVIMHFVEMIKYRFICLLV
jgi:hypothetical protein